MSDLLQFPEASSSLRSRAGLVEDKSCNVDVEDELPPELTDNPGQCLHLLGWPWFLTADPLVGISVVFAKFSKR